MLLQTNSYVVPKEKRAEHARLMRRFRQALGKLGCDMFEVYEQVGANWGGGETNGRYVQIMRFRDRKHQLAVQSAERNDPTAQALIAEFCELVNFPYQQQQGFFAVGFYNSVLPAVTAREPDGQADAGDSAEESATEDDADESAAQAIGEAAGTGHEAVGGLVIDTPALPDAAHSVVTQEHVGESVEESLTDHHQPVAEDGDANETSAAEHVSEDPLIDELAMDEPLLDANTNGEHFVEEEPLSEEELLGEISGHEEIHEPEHGHEEAAITDNTVEPPPAEAPPPQRVSLFQRRPRA